MLIQKRTCLGLVAGATVITTVFLSGCDGRRSKELSAETPAPVSTAYLPPRKAPPIPNARSLAKPRSLKQVGLPVELTRTVTPAGNPSTPEEIDLGQKLFFEGRLSADGTVACATCHDPARAFTDGRPRMVNFLSRIGTSYSGGAWGLLPTGVLVQTAHQTWSSTERRIFGAELSTDGGVAGSPLHVGLQRLLGLPQV
jgi:hypothetical protein